MIPHTPSPTSHGVRADRQLPRLLGSPDNNRASAGLRSPLSKAPKGLHLQPTAGGVSAEPFTYGDVDGSTPHCRREVAGVPSLLTPSTRSMLSVQNTFLHFRV